VKIAHRVPLAPLTTLGVGGPAHLLVEAETEDEVAEALSRARSEGLPVLVLGGGSNLLVADRGFPGLVLRPRVRGVRVEAGEGAVQVEAGAGEPWDAFVDRAVASGWAGVECLSGIPGEVGATPIQNVGAYGQEVADTIFSVRAIDRGTFAFVTLDAARCGFGYRDSVFKGADAGRFVIVAVSFALRPGGAPAVRYAELAGRFAGRAAPSLAEVRDAVIALRRAKSMVLDPADENGRSAGSFFTNPVIEPGAIDAVRARVEASGALAPGERMPEHPAPGGRVKLSAAWLIERAGFRKGTADGAVGISTRHSLALVNRGGATAAAIVAFARRVKGAVHERFGVDLHPEPVLVGFEPGEGV
jgi:UDP-N-acetylmuramate dehydrogenase